MEDLVGVAAVPACKTQIEYREKGAVDVMSRNDAEPLGQECEIIYSNVVLRRRIDTLANVDENCVRLNSKIGTHQKPTSSPPIEAIIFLKYPACARLIVVYRGAHHNMTADRYKPKRACATNSKMHHLCIVHAFRVCLPSR